MDRKYFPDNLMLEFSIRYAIAGKASFPQDLSQLKKTYIKIYMKGGSVITIKKDPLRTDAAILLLLDNRVMKHESLEASKDELGRVEASYEGQAPELFDNYQQFLDWLQVK